VKKKKPKTRPTGFVPKDAKRAPPIEDTAIDLQTVKAWRVKVVYMQERGRWESLKAGHFVSYTPPSSYDGRAAVTIDGDESEAAEVQKAKSSVWQRTVDWCEARDIHPEEYVRQCFHLLTLGRTFAPEPHQLLGDVYLKHWTETQGKRADSIKLALQMERNTASQHFALRHKVYSDKEEVAQIAVIADGSTLGLSPLFRFCLASGGSTPRVRRLAQRLFVEAVLQFESSRRLYKRYWADILPPGFSKSSRDAYPQLLRELWIARKE